MRYPSAPRGGRPQNPYARERACVVELRLMCRIVGLDVDPTGGGTAGNWGRRQLELDVFELMLLARKPGG